MPHHRDCGSAGIAVPLHSINKYNKIVMRRIALVIAVLLSFNTSILAEGNATNTSSVRYVKVPRFARPLVEKWITEYAKTQLIQGVRQDEDPRLTIAWTIPGSSLTTPVIPLWITPHGELPQIVTRNSQGHATLVDVGFQLKDQLFPIKRGNGADYINLARLINHAGTGILQQIEPIEDEIFSRGKQVIETMRKNGKAGRETTEFYRWVDQYVSEQYEKRFHLM